MKVFIDLESLQLIEGPGFRSPVNALRFKRGDAALLEVAFLEGGTTQTLIGDAAALELRFGIKPRNRYDVGYLVHTADWTMPEPDAEKPVYQCSPSFNTMELDSALGVGSSTGSELSEILLMGEITWREGEGLPTSTRTFPVIVENDVNRGTEGVPTSAEPAYPAPEGIVSISTLGNHAVRFDLVQSLSDEQKAQARANIGAGSGGGGGGGNLVFRGIWSESETYAENDWVSDGPQLFRNTTGTNNVGAPSTDLYMYVWVPMTSLGGASLSVANSWSGHQSFNGGISIWTPVSGMVGDLFYRDMNGFVSAIAPGMDGQVLTLSAGIPLWTDSSAPSGGGTWLPLAFVIHDGTSLTSGPITMPTFLGASERLKIRATVNDFDTQLYYIDWTVGNGSLECVMISQSLADAGLIIDSPGGYPHFDSGYNPPTTQLRSGDTWSYFYQVPDINLYMWGPSDSVTWMGNPYTPYVNTACHITLEYQIVPRT